MKALVFKRYGGPDQVAFADIPRPVPKPDEILVMVHAAGLNPIDNMILKGTFKPILQFQLPATLGSDLAGVVVEVGSRVTRFKPGDAVFASVFDLGTGALAEFALVPEYAAALKPANLDFVQAASIPMVGLTSWQALKERMHLKPGQKVFIPAGAGGIGTFAIQLAKYLGAKVGTTTSTGNVDMVQSLGADEVIDYTKQEFDEVLRDCDAVLGTLRGDSLEKSLRILKPKSIAVSLVGPPDAAFGRARHELFHGLRAVVAELEDESPSQKTKRRVFIPLRAFRWQPTRRDRRASQVGKHPAGDRQGLSVRSSEGGACVS
ncbi:MAG: NADP-dependent oxidoreductase [Gemmataceae bacterium]|nr:NADP-dependent oxidoreductase [Gemmataceae bacterium]